MATKTPISQGLFITLSALAALLVLLFVKLGFWQLARAQEKQTLLNLHQLRTQQVAHHWQSQDASPPLYQHLKLTGHYLPTHILWDNQYQQGQWGTDVLTPFVLADRTCWVMVDRGLVPRGLDRHQQPNIITPTGVQTISGSVYYLPQKHWLLGQNIEWQDKNMALLEYPDGPSVAGILHKCISPFIIRLDQDMPAGFARQWAIVSSPPYRHYGYAAQWFAFALTIVIIFVALMRRKQHEH